MRPYPQDSEDERILRLEILLDQLRFQNAELTERVEVELERLRLERRQRTPARPFQKS
jgi:hypothetical protein